MRFHEKIYVYIYIYTHTRGTDKSLARPGRKQARKHVRDARDFNKIEARAVIKFVFLQGTAPKEIHAILTETLACFFPVRAKNLSAPLHIYIAPLPPFSAFISDVQTCAVKNGLKYVAYMTMQRRVWRMSLYIYIYHPSDQPEIIFASELTKSF